MKEGGCGLKSFLEQRKRAPEVVSECMGMYLVMEVVEDRGVDGSLCQCSE